MPDLWIGVFASFICTTFGALPALLLKQVSHKGRDILLSYTAGIMVAAATFGLIPVSLALANLWVMAAGIMAGTLLLLLLELVIPHVDPDHSTQQRHRAQGAYFLFLAAMAIHNIPEGLSVGLSHASEQGQLGNVVAVAIGLQNIFDGFLIALFLQIQGLGRLKALVLTGFTGLLEMLAYLLGYRFSAQWTEVIPGGLAFAAGAMLFVVYKEIIPESHGDGNARASTFSFILGLVTMIILTEAWG